MRLDLHLVSAGLAETRQKAKYLIDEGAVYLDGKPCLKSSAEADGRTVEVRGEGLRYVSRGGLKLEGAIQAFSLDFSGVTAIDVGASTGGFTDCLLQHGADKVYAVDSGSDQLHPKLRDDPRVISMENCNARLLSPSLIPEPLSIAVMDVSFISQTLLYPPLRSVLREGATLVSLIKPQFEAGRKDVGKGGIVKDAAVRERVLREVLAAAEKETFYCTGLTVSPIRGGDGNIEYIGCFRLGGAPVAICAEAIKRLVGGNASSVDPSEKG